MKTLHLSLLLIFLLTTVAHSQTSQPPLCKADQLRLITDDEDGNFDGMSHSGTLVIVRNLSPDVCSIQPIAQITMVDAAGKDLNAQGLLPGARFLHHGPVVMPIILPSGAEATASLRWISSPVFDKNVCITPKTLRVALGSAILNTVLGKNICGDAAKGITFEQTRFATDPVYRSPDIPPSVTK